MVELFANSGGSDQIHHSVASDLGLHCFPVTLFSSPELKAQSELLLSLTVSRRRRPYVRPSVHNL